MYDVNIDKVIQAVTEQLKRMGTDGIVVVYGYNHLLERVSERCDIAMTECEETRDLPA